MSAGEPKTWLFPPRAPTAVPIAGSAARFPVHRVFGVGQNYVEHAKEMGESGREPPCFFAKPAAAVSTSSSVPYPPMTRDFQHEVELVVALGSGGREIPDEEALDRVFGYAVGVDLTRRDLQSEAKSRGHPWTTAKGFEHSAPLSAIRPASECGHPVNQRIRLWVNDQLRQQARTSEMIWSVAEIIAELSRYFELRPGDLIFTGTPAGIGALQPGDRLVCQVENVAELRFRIGARPES